MKSLNLKEMEVVEGGGWFTACGRGVAAMASLGGLHYGALLGGPAGAIGAGLLGCAIGIAADQ
jgi:hypothetical protein